MHIYDIKPHMPHTYAFSRFTLAMGIAAYLGKGSSVQYLTESSRILRRARRDGIVRFLENRSRSVYYEFVTAGMM